MPDFQFSGIYQVKLINPHLKTPEFTVDPETLKSRKGRFENSGRNDFWADMNGITARWAAYGQGHKMAGSLCKRLSSDRISTAQRFILLCNAIRHFGHGLMSFFLLNLPFIICKNLHLSFRGSTFTPSFVNEYTLYKS